MTRHENAVLQMGDQVLLAKSKDHYQDVIIFLSHNSL
jgi:hypothetical protein